LWLIWAASWIVPARSRRAWLQKREAEVRQWWLFLAERGDRSTDARQQVLQRCWEAFTDAFAERFPGAQTEGWPRRTVRGPRFLFAALAAAPAVILAGTGFLSSIRTVYRPLPFPEANRLVACYQVHFLSASLGVQARYFEPWREESQTLTGLAAYHIETYVLSRPGSNAMSLDGARVTPDFFEVLGAKAMLGRTFGPQENPTEAEVVLSYRLWRSDFGSNRQIVNLPITLDGRSFRVIGVLPPDFWFHSPSLDLWTLSPNATRTGQTPDLLRVIGRLRPGATARAARAELDGIALHTPGFRGGSLRVAPLDEYLRPALSFIFSVFVAAISLGLATALLQWLRSCWRLRSCSWAAFRYWAFFFAKSGLLAASVAAACAELSAWNTLGLHSSKFVVSLLADWLVVLGVLLTFQWAILDQARRCPVCLRLLSTPFTSGSWSSALIEPASTEMLCDQGHGTLCVSDSYTTLGEIRRWVTLEDSWREVLSSSGK
jgi:hypothetical protein